MRRTLGCGIALTMLAFALVPGAAAADVIFPVALRADRGDAVVRRRALDERAVRSTGLVVRRERERTCRGWARAARARGARLDARPEAAWPLSPAAPAGVPERLSPGLTDRATHTFVVETLTAAIAKHRAAASGGTSEPRP